MSTMELAHYPFQGSQPAQPAQTDFYPGGSYTPSPLHTLALAAAAAADDMKREALLESASTLSASDDSLSPQQGLKAHADNVTGMNDYVRTASLSAARRDSNDSSSSKSRRFREIQCPRPGCGRLYSSENSLRNHLRIKHAYRGPRARQDSNPNKPIDPDDLPIVPARTPEPMIQPAPQLQPKWPLVAPLSAPTSTPVYPRPARWHHYNHQVSTDHLQVTRQLSCPQQYSTETAQAHGSHPSEDTPAWSAPPPCVPPANDTYPPVSSQSNPDWDTSNSQYSWPAPQSSVPTPYPPPPSYAHYQPTSAPPAITSQPMLEEVEVDAALPPHARSRNKFVRRVESAPVTGQEYSQCRQEVVAWQNAPERGGCVPME